MAASTKGYESGYSESSFWGKCRGAFKTAGAEVIERALWLFYALKRPETPFWAKTAIVGALGYFISPIDVIPDAIPILGFTDDLGVLVAAVGAVSQYIDEKVKQQAKSKMQEWGLV